MRPFSRNGGLVLPLLSLVVRGAVGQATVDYAKVCNEISTRVTSASAVYLPRSTQYTSNLEHWAESSSQPAACTVEPGTAADVGLTLRIIAKYDAAFAVKSGGHAFNPNTSSTLGVLVVTNRFNKIEYKSADQTATIGLGTRWEEVYAALEPFKRTVTGARVPHVGVGGFIANGGYSFLANRVGLAIDTVLGYEHVLPNGTVTRVTAASNAELFWALKGGGNNFGVITKVTMKTFPQDLVWGGSRTISDNQTDAVLQAIAKWDSQPNDPNAGVLIVFNRDTKTPGITTILDMFYDGPTPPKGLFDAYLAIPYTTSNVSTRKFTNLFPTQALAPSLPGLQGEQVPINRFPLPVIRNWIAEFNNIADTLKNTSAAGLVTAMEPFNRDLLSKAPPLPGFATPSAWPPTRKFATFSSSFLATYTDPKDADAAADAVVRAAANVRTIAAQAGVTETAVGAPDVGKYPNGGHWRSTPAEIYGSALPRLRQLSRKYDPTGLMKRAGGFKFE